MEGGGRELLSTVESDLVDAARELRVVIDDLRPPALEELGLVEAVRRRLDRLAAGSGVAITLATGPGLAPLPRMIEHAVLRIVSEAASNAIRHGSARRCHVTLAREDDVVEISVSDDGRGFTGVPPEGHGLRSMRERAAELGGSCEWRSAPAAGTRVESRLPVRRR